MHPILFSILLTIFVSTLAYPNPNSLDYQNRRQVIKIEVENVIFTIYTRSNSDPGTTVTTGDSAAIATSGFNASRPTKVITHGFLDDMRGHIKTMKNSFLKMGDFNIILVDWSFCAIDIRYEQAVVCAKQVGNYIGNLIAFLHEEFDLNIKDVHLLGHSLGAEVIAFVSEVLPERVARISGMDPAGPLFEHEDPSERLDAEDADFVDVIHTCKVLLGIHRPVGTVDFYPNGGDPQPGCSSVFAIDCNHGAAHAYYMNTIPENGRNKYIAAKCDSYEDARNKTCSGEPGIMGYDSIKSSPGIYYLGVTEPPLKVTEIEERKIKN